MNFPRTTKIEVFPQAKNSLLVRIENIADIFDGAQPVPYVRLDTLASYLYNLSNVANSTKPTQTIITETSLTGNQLISQVYAGKTQWVGVDDEFIDPPTQPQDKSQYEIALEAQRIRTFIITYVVLTQETPVKEAFLQE